MKEIVLDGERLSINDVVSVSRGAKVAIKSDATFLKRIDDARRFLIEYISKGLPTYGVTTGFGDSCDGQISVAKSKRLQASIVHFHGIGVGRFFTKAECRAILVARLNSNIKGGYSAIRIELVRKLEELLNKDVVPAIPTIGSVGASGDLTPLSYIAAVVMGEKQVYYKDRLVDTRVAFDNMGIAPLSLEAKEGLAIMNGTSCMTGIAALAINDAARLANLSDFVTAAVSEIVRGKDVPFRAKVSKIKNHKGQCDSAAYIYDIIKDAPRVYKYEEFLKMLGESNAPYKKTASKIQDRYSIRCAPEINGVVRDTISIAVKWIEEELNSANDNPLVDVEARALYNTGNFYGGHVCAACDYMRIALANISDMLDKQAELIIDGKFNNLTPNLIPYIDDKSEEAGLHFGFKAVQISISAIRAEIQFLASPISIHSSPTEALNQDKVSLGTISARKLCEMVNLMYLQYAMMILAIMQAVDLIGVANFSDTLQKAYHEVRRLSSFVTEDRALDTDVNKISQFLRNSPLFNYR